MGSQLRIGGASIMPFAVIAQAIPRLSRHDLEGLTERLIDLLDTIDGDPDEETGNDVEDDFQLSEAALDRVRQDHRVDCVDQDATSWTEWQSRGRHKLALGQFETANSHQHEDEEDDDPDTGVEDGPRGFDPEEDMCTAGDDGCGPVLIHGQLRWGSEWEDPGQ